MEKIKKLAENILVNSVNLQAGEKIYLEGIGPNTQPLLRALIEKAVELGGIPFYFYNDSSLTNAMLKHTNEDQVKGFSDFHAQIMQQMDVFVGIRSHNNPCNDSDSSEIARKWYNQHFVGNVQLGIRVHNTRWCVMRYPNDVMAFGAGLSNKQFEEFYYKSCLIDYGHMEKCMYPLVELMKKTDKVHIIAPYTDLTFSIAGIGAKACCGHRNIPDGEVFTAPVKDSINGYIRFNTPDYQNGKRFSNVELTFKDGQIVSAKHDGSTQDLLDVINTDDGSRYMGEFALGINPYITRPMGDALFDEKITGSLHMAIGNSLPDAPNGNRSGIHWDLVQIQTPEYGGGEIWFDDVLIRRDGLFVVPELELLNPENLALWSM